MAILICTAARAQVTAASCSASDVQTALNSVTSSTTTVTIPAGTCDWTAQVNFTVPSGSTNLSILGAGSLTTTGGGDVTVIVDNYSANGYLFGITTAAASSKFRLAGITFEGGNGGVKYNGFVQINGSSANIRFDHSHYDPATYSPAQPSAGTRWVGCTYGVYDHNIWDGPSGAVNNAVQAYNAATCFGDPAGLGHESWANPTNFGTAEFLYMENNVFNNGSSDDCLEGGRFVSRFNTYNETGPSPTIQTHPTGSDGGFRGCRAQEIYQNTMTASPGSYINANIWINSGTAMIWGNTAPSSSSGGGTGYKNFIELLSTRQNNGTYPQIATPGGWGYCGTLFNGTGSNWDENTNTSSGYHCMDDAGRGQGDLLAGGFTSDGSGTNNMTNTVTGCISTASCAYPRQASEPIYEWADNYSAVPSNPSFLLADSEPTAHFNNADYYLWCNVSSLSGCTSFTGATGTGSGTLASMPSTCTTGVAYWATDQGSWNTSGGGGQGELYKCTATNTWTLFYTPYTYPHPLVTGGGGGTTQTPVFTPAGGTFSSPASNPGAISMVVTVPSPDAGSPILWCFTGGASCTPATSEGSTPYTISINPTPPNIDTICANSTAAGKSVSATLCQSYIVSTAIATGDSIARTEPVFPATSTCHLYPATAWQHITNTVNLDPWNPTISSPGHLNGTGGTSYEPSSSASSYIAAETDDTALQTYINGMAAGACVEITVGASGQDAIVENLSYQPQNSSGQGVNLVIDGGVRVYRTRNLADYSGSCGNWSITSPVTTSCPKWITPTATNANIYGYGILDGRAWSRFTSSSTCPSGYSPCSFNTLKVLSYCMHPGNSFTWAGIPCPGTTTTSSTTIVANGPNMLEYVGASNTVLYKITLLNSGQFNIFWGNGANNFLGWGIKFLESGEVSNSDGFDPSYAASNGSLIDSFCSVGDNCVSIKSNSAKAGTSSCSAGANASCNISVLNFQTGSNVGGATIGYESSGGVNNVLYNGLVQNGGFAVNPGQQVGHGINGASSEGGAVSLVTYENSCVTNESEHSLLYAGGPGQMTSISEINTTILKGSGTGNTGNLEFQGQSGALLGLTLNNVNAVDSTGALSAPSYSNSQANIGLGPNNVNFHTSLTSAGGTGVTVTNNITNPGSTPFTCTTSTWQPLIGEAWFSTSTANNLQALSVASPGTYTVNATVMPTRAYPSTKESLFLNQTGTQGAPAATVEFTDNGSPVSGCTAVPLIHGDEFASCSLTGVTAGTHVYQVVYNATGSDTNYPTAFTWGNPGTGNQLTAVVTGSGPSPATQVGVFIP